MFGAFLAAKSRFRYLRLLVTDLCGPDGVSNTTLPIDIVDLRYLRASTAYPTVNMTADNAPSPLVASASAVNSGFSLGAYQALDGNAATSWIGDSIGSGGNQWLTLDFGAGNGLRPLGIRITPRAERYPRAFQVLGSNSGAWAGEQRTLYSAAAVITGWADDVARDFTF